MALVYTSASGVPGDQFDHPTVNAQRSVVLQELPNVGVQKSQIGWLPAVAPSNVLTLLAAGHAPGLYMVSFALVVRLAATFGTTVGTISFTAPNLGATTLAVNGAAVVTLGVSNTGGVSRVIESTGATAITLQMGTGPLPAPVIDIYASAVMVGA